MSAPSDRLQQMSAIKLALMARRLRAAGSEAQVLSAEPIAIVGMGCRFPGGANDPESYWRLLESGTDAIREVPADRWDSERLVDLDPAAPGKMTTRWGGFLDAIDGFDAEFFGIAPREALQMDPQQRLFLEVCCEALDDAGMPRGSLAGLRAGVFAASYHSDYAQAIYGCRTAIGAHTVTGAAHSVLANRLSYLLDLRGPSVSIDTACSSSLVALHLACQSLRQGECDLALAGGVSLMITPELSIALSKWGFLAADGRCKTFDARANGFVRGEGCGAIVLKRLGDALSDGDRVLALVRGSAVNQDGRTSVLTAPSGLAQQAVVREALANAALAPKDISYVEAHGTGTELGDPIELEALAAVLGPRPADQPVLIGSVKTNIGHLEAAAGLAGVIKVVLALRENALPPHLHFTTPNPHFDFQSSPFRIPTTLQPWVAGDAPRRAGVSSFGFGGTNAHVVLEEAPKMPLDERDAGPRPPFLLPLTARTPAALAELARRHALLLRGLDASQVCDICHSAATGRDMLEQRCAVVGETSEQLIEALDAVAAGETAAGASVGRLQLGASAGVAFVYSGQGPQWWAMGRELMATEPVFAGAIAACEDAMRPYAPWTLSEELNAPEAHSRLHRTDIAQPALFAVQVALTALWREWGVIPTAVVGHSMGEIAAAHAAGAFDLRDASRLAVARGSIMHAASGRGGMAAVEVDAAEGERLAAASGGLLSLAAINAPRSVVLSGDPVALDEMLRTLAARGIGHRRLPVDYAFHSTQMESFRAPLADALAFLAPGEGDIAFHSTVSGERLDTRALNAAYWTRNLREPVRFASAIRSVAADGLRIFLELGPHPVLAAAVQATLDEVDGVTVATSLRRGRPERASLLTALGRLFTVGVDPDWRTVQNAGRRVSVPSYPWQRTRFWVALPAPGIDMPAPTPTAHPLLGRPVDSPALQGAAFDGVLSAQHPAWLSEHRIGVATILPATALIEMAIAAGGDGRTLTDLVLGVPLNLSEGPRRVQVVTGVAGGEVTVFSRPVDGPAGDWTRHAQGRLAPGAAAPTLAGLPVESRTRCTISIDRDALYADLAAAGLDFGPAFRGVARVLLGVDEALASIEAPDDIAGTLGAYRFHPALLDACIQPCTALLRAKAPSAGVIDAAVYLPFAIDAFEQWHAAVPRLSSHVLLRAAHGDADVRIADVTVRDDAGRVIAQMRGLRLRRASVAAVGGSTHADLYREAWEQAPHAGSPRELAATRWLVCTPTDAGTEVCEALCDALRETGAHATALALSDGAAVASVLAAASCDGVILVSGADAVPIGMQAADASAADRAGASGLVLAQALVRSGRPQTPLWLATRGARQVFEGDAVDPVQAADWGLARAAEIEHPELRWRRVDLDPAGGDDGWHRLLAELQRADDPELECAWRAQVRWAPRLRPVARSAVLPAPGSPAVWRLQVSRSGSIDDLAVVADVRRDPEAGEVEIEIQAAGLNFRDVLNAMGMYPGDAGRLGGECAGVVRRVGSNVVGFAVGDQVMAFADGTFASHVSVDARRVARRPISLGLVQAAATPIPFLTGLYGLDRLAGLRRGERVLIHAAAGGVGLAAVQIAQRLGAEVFATAGSPTKRRLLRRLGVRHVFDSRSTAFRAEVSAATDGEGVHVVLNALAGEFIAASVDVLAAGGRFVEMGKREIWSAERMASARPDVRYYPFDLGVAALADGSLVPSLFAELATHLDCGELRPLPVAAVPVERAQQGFRTMAQARHIGKVVLVMDPAKSPLAQPLDPDGTFVVTGGFGALGLHVARWLASRGAKHLLLAGRSTPSDAARAVIDRLRLDAVSVQAVQLDAADERSLHAHMAASDVASHPIRGLVHCAGVLDDGVLLEQTPDRLRRVMDPKLAAAMALHRATSARRLDFFVLFSAGAAVLGSPGQSTYCAANLALDAFAESRRCAGLPATSIAWGPWTEGGMAASLTGRDAARWLERGVRSLDTSTAIALLERAIAGPEAAVSALDVDWSRFAAHTASPRFDRLPRGAAASRSGRAAEAPSRATLQSRLDAAAPTQRVHIIDAFLREQARAALGLDSHSSIEDHRPLKELGLDSLMAVELRNAIVAAAGRPLPATLLFDHPTLAALRDHLCNLLLPSDQPAAPRLFATTTATSTDIDAAAVAAMSEADAQAQLLAELGLDESQK